MRLLVLAALGLTPACATEVYQEGKSREQTRRDVEICSDHGELSSLDPIVALEIAYECLEKKGYKRRPAGSASLR